MINCIFTYLDDLDGEQLCLRTSAIITDKMDKNIDIREGRHNDECPLQDRLRAQLRQLPFRSSNLCSRIHFFCSQPLSSLVWGPSCGHQWVWLYQRLETSWRSNTERYVYHELRRGHENTKYFARNEATWDKHLFLLLPLFLQSCAIKFCTLQVGGFHCNLGAELSEKLAPPPMAR